MKYDIAALKRKMLVKYPFFGSVVANVDYKENKDIPTAGTDGKTIYYNTEYLKELSIEEQTFVFAHEVCHIAFNHILRSEGKNSELWNIATDAVTNQFLKQDGLKMPQGGVDIAEAINYDAEQLYEKLLQESQQQQQSEQNDSQQKNSNNGSSENQDNGQQNTQQSQTEQQENSNGESSEKQDDSQQQNNSNDENSENKNKDDSQQNKQQSQTVQQDNSNDGSSEKQDVGHDTHSMWEQAVKKQKEQEEESNKKENLSGKDKEKEEVEKKQKELESMGEKDAFKKNLEDKKKQLEELKEEILNHASQAGTSTNRDIRMVNDIGSAKQLIDWRYILREAIKYDVDWSYKNATLEDGVVIANLEEQPMSETEIVLDTSGSIDEVLLKNFLRECKNILQYTKLKVGCFDTEFYGFHEIRTEKDIENMKFEGNGGTDFDVAVGAFSRRVENKIIFTDGDGPMPEMPLDAIWLVFGNEKINPKGGKVIYITQEQLDRLYSYETKSKRKVRKKI